MPSPHRRPLKILVITMGGDRQRHMEDMLHEINQHEHGIEVGFSEGVPSRSLRHRWGCLQWLHSAGLLPQDEWRAIEEYYHTHGESLPEALTDALRDVPILPRWKPSPEQREPATDEPEPMATIPTETTATTTTVHYSLEFWQKAKTINRGRSVLACLLAHLIAMQRLVEEDWDLILEDNVRAPAHDCLERIRQLQEATSQANQEDQLPIHLRYFGWLGSRHNLTWCYEKYLPVDAITAPLPTAQDILPQDAPAGGTPVWGMYAYWISSQALAEIRDRLRHDVGAILWRTKRARHYTVKPIDKIVPRIICQRWGQDTCVVARQPAFFRAPMLTSRIHSKWDGEFCKSTEVQLTFTSLQWEDLWLSSAEKAIVAHYRDTNEWITMGQLSARDAGSEEQHSK